MNMKKLFLALLILLVVASGAFAQAFVFGEVNVKSNLFEVDIPESGDATFEAGQTYGDVYVGFAAQGETAGGSLLFYATSGFGIPADLVSGSAGPLAYLANAAVWYKPFSFLKIDAGLGGNVDTFRGKFGGLGTWTSFLGSAIDSTGDAEDDIFTRAAYTTGWALEITPIEGLDIIAAVNNAGVDFSTHNTFVSTWADNLAVQVGYNLKDIGLFRAQYVGPAGKNGSALGDVGRIEGAAQLLFVPGLNLDVGFKLPVEENNVYAFSLSAAASYEIAGIGLQARYDGAFGKYYTTNVIGIMPSYQITDNLGAYAYAGFKLGTGTGNQYFDTAIAVWLKFAMGKGYIAPGVKIDILDSQNTFKISIPVRFNYSL
jgi:hypothetical protein